MRWSGPAVFLVLSVTFQAPSAHAQVSESPEPIVTDRPDFTESAETVDRGRIQAESGYTFTRSDEADEHTLGEVLIRIGLVDGLEGRRGLESYGWVDGPGADDSGLEDPFAGIKVRLARAPERPGWRPGAAILAGTVLPGADAFGEGEWQPEAVLALAWDAGAASVGSNLGWAHASDSGERFDQGLASLAVGFDLVQRWAGYLEVFGLMPAAPDDDDAVVANGGLTFLVNDDLQLDARVGAGLTSAAPDVFVGVGVAKRW